MHQAHCFPVIMEEKVLHKGVGGSNNGSPRETTLDKLLSVTT